MKKGLIVFCLLLGLSSAVMAQVRVGVKGGISTFDLPSNEITILDASEAEDFKLGVADAKFGLHLGMFFQVIAGAFYLQPEILFNSQTVDFSIEDIQGIEEPAIRDENYQYIDLPLTGGFRFGPVRLGGGVIGHFLVNSTSDLKDLEGYTQDLERFTYGWQAGAGLDIWRMHIDVKYEGNFSDFGDHIVFHGNKYTFGSPPTRLIASLGVSF